MTNFSKENLEEEQRLNEIREDHSLNGEEKRVLLNEVKRTPSVPGGNSSFKTTMSLANLNFGFTLLVFGLQNKANGFLSGLAAILVMLGITTKTSFLQLFHCKNHELDFPEVIERILGPGHKKIYTISACFYIALNQMINFVYACDMLYWMISFIAEKGGSNLPEKSHFTFSSFSYQYTGLIMFVIMNLAFLIKKVTILASLGPIGIAAVFVVVGFSVVNGIINFANAGNIFHLQFSFQDITILMAAYSMGFFGHYWQLPILKNNSNQNNNKRDLGLSFIVTGVLFYVDAFFGSIAIADKAINTEVSILDFFQSSWIIFVIRAMVLIQISTAAIMSIYLMKGKLWNIFPNNKKGSPKIDFLVNVIITLFWLLIQMFNVDTKMLIGLVGAVGAFLGIYIYPIVTHLRCLYKDFKVIEERLLSSSSSCRHDISNSKKAIIPTAGEPIFKELADKKNKSVIRESCTSAHDESKNGIPKGVRVASYVLMLVIGLGMIIVRIYSLAN